MIYEPTEAPGMVPVPKSELAYFRNQITGGLVRLLKDAGEYRMNDIMERLLDDRMQLWIAPNCSWVITQVSEYPTKKVITVLYAGGNLQTIRRHMGDLEAWARERNCNEIRVQGREGWERVFQMERLGVVLRSEL